MWINLVHKITRSLEVDGQDDTGPSRNTRLPYKRAISPKNPKIKQKTITLIFLRNSCASCLFMNPCLKIHEPSVVATGHNKVTIWRIIIARIHLRPTTAGRSQTSVKLRQPRRALPMISTEVMPEEKSLKPHRLRS